MNKKVLKSKIKEKLEEKKEKDKYKKSRRIGGTKYKKKGIQLSKKMFKQSTVK